MRKLIGAEVVAKVISHGRTETVTATYAGENGYLGSAVQDQIVWGQPI